MDRLREINKSGAMTSHGDDGDQLNCPFDVRFSLIHRDIVFPTVRDVIIPIFLISLPQMLHVYGIFTYIEPFLG